MLESLHSKALMMKIATADHEIDLAPAVEPSTQKARASRCKTEINSDQAPRPLLKQFSGKAKVLLVDYENIAFSEVDQLRQEDEIIFFLGAKQTLNQKTIDLAKSLSLNYRCKNATEKTRNALDIMLAYELGKMQDKLGDKEVIIVSNDKDYDGVICCLVNQGINAKRSSLKAKKEKVAKAAPNVNKAPQLAMKKKCQKKLTAPKNKIKANDDIKVVTESLMALKTPWATNIKTFRKFIKKTLRLKEAKETDKAMSSLINAGLISTSKRKIVYQDMEKHRIKHTQIQKCQIASEHPCCHAACNENVI